MVFLSNEIQLLISGVCELPKRSLRRQDWQQQKQALEAVEVKSGVDV